MKLNKKAFSFVEILVAILIIAILMYNWISYFWDFVDKSLMVNKLDKIKNLIEIENEKIENKEIFDYKIEFFQNKNYFIIYENIVWNDINIVFDGINNFWTGSFSFSWANSWTWIIKYYKSYKFQKKEILDYNETFTWDLSEKIDYKITWTFSGKTLNNIIFDYFNYKENQDINYIWTNKQLINILGKKNYDSVWIEFENDKWLKDKILIN